MKLYHEQLPFDGWWLDINDMSSWYTGSCGAGRLADSPVYVPFKLPGEPGQINYEYLQYFDVTNATEAAFASAASASQDSAYPTPTTTTVTGTVGFTSPTPGIRNITFPPYALNLTLEGHSLLREAVAPYAVHNDNCNATEYELHNTYGYISGKSDVQRSPFSISWQMTLWISRSYLRAPAHHRSLGWRYEPALGLQVHDHTASTGLQRRRNSLSWH
jgi:alpha-glucosidase